MNSDIKKLIIAMVLILSAQTQDWQHLLNCQLEVPHSVDQYYNQYCIC
jgi:hypothetical protein